MATHMQMLWIWVLAKKNFLWVSLYSLLPKCHFWCFFGDSTNSKYSPSFFGFLPNSHLPKINLPCFCKFGEYLASLVNNSSKSSKNQVYIVHFRDNFQVNKGSLWSICNNLPLSLKKPILGKLKFLYIPFVTTKIYHYFVYKRTKKPILGQPKCLDDPFVNSYLYHYHYCCLLELFFFICDSPRKICTSNEQVWQMLHEWP